ncbi:MAG: superoxide dismutase family protein [Christensenellales bacterium]|jgi:Cu-Zn family superoxide dismutase
MINKAKAVVKGGLLYPDINGTVLFTQFRDGVEINVKIHNLPAFSRADGKAVGPFGFHIHNGKSCEIGTIDDQFPLSGTHYNPGDRPHGDHAGDFPVLMPMSDGTAMMKFTSDKFLVSDIMGLTVLIHESPDDYRTEPAGNSGEKIACGVITPF